MALCLIIIKVVQLDILPTHYCIHKSDLLLLLFLSTTTVVGGGGLNY